MKSICLKTIKQSEINNLIKFFDNMNTEQIKINRKKFPIFYNIIVHYLGTEKNRFLYSLSNIISEYIIENYENKFIKSCINRNYFYFDDYEKEIIYKISLRILELQELELGYKKEILSELVYDYLINNKSIFIEGFVNFRVKEYIEILDYVVELAVTNYIKFI